MLLGNIVGLIIAFIIKCAISLLIGYMVCLNILLLKGLVGLTGLVYLLVIGMIGELQIRFTIYNLFRVLIKNFARYTV